MIWLIHLIELWVQQICFRLSVGIIHLYLSFQVLTSKLSSSLSEILTLPLGPLMYD